MNNANPKGAQLSRQLGLIGLTATGICSMLGASINVVPFMIQRNVEGIGPYVLPAFLIAAVPALLAAFCYSILASAMPRAGGSYIYASRGLNPYLGFIASFSQWFGLSIVIGVIAYIIVPFLRDVAIAMDWVNLAGIFENSFNRLVIALFLIWSFVFVNIRGAKFYERTVIPLMVVMFALGFIAILGGFWFDHTDFANALLQNENRIIENKQIQFDWRTLFSAAAVMFSSFIGFDSIAQAGGEAKNPTRNLPLAIFLAVFTVGAYYFLFTAAIYHAVPWSFIAAEALEKDISAPGMLSYLLPSTLSVLILVGAAIALINDLPAMLLSVSRLMYAWAKDEVFPSQLSRVHRRYKTPVTALFVSGIIASFGVFGSHFAGDFFLGIDIMITSMMVNFLFMCLTVVVIPRVNPALANNIRVGKQRAIQRILGWSGIVVILFFLITHVYKDIAKTVEAWYFHSTWIWIIVMALGSFVFLYKRHALQRQGVNIKERFMTLPKE